MNWTGIKKVLSIQYLTNFAQISLSIIIETIKNLVATLWFWFHFSTIKFVIIQNGQLSITFSNSQPKELLNVSTNHLQIGYAVEKLSVWTTTSICCRSCAVVSLMHAVWNGPQAIRKKDRGENFVDEEFKVCVCVWWLLARSSRVMEQLICWLTPVSLRTLLPVQPLHYFYFHFGHTNRDLQPPTGLWHTV